MSAAAGPPDIIESLLESEIHDELRREPALIDNWIHYSADKRTTSGWYLEPADAGYVVGYFDGASRKEETIYRDATEAVAAFIKRELTAISS